MKTLLHPDKSLTTPTDKILTFDDYIRYLGDQMLSHMRKEGGIGLAANQVGENISLFVSEKPSLYDGRWMKHKIICNPTWTPTPSGFQYHRVEGCLSYPGWLLPIPRYDAIIAEYYTWEGKRTKAILHRVAAQVFQHETEHLLGESFTKHLTIQQQETLRKFYKE